MTVELQHPMKPEATPEDVARGRFTSGIRGLILNDLAADMRSAYERRAAPAFKKEHGREPENAARRIRLFAEILLSISILQCGCRLKKWSG